MSNELRRFRQAALAEFGVKTPGGGTSIDIRQVKQRASAETYELVLTAQHEVCANVDRSPFYFYTIKVPTKLDNIPFINPETIVVWYPSLIKSSDKFGDAQDNLFAIGEKMNEGIEDTDQLVDASREILSNGYLMTSFLNNFQEAPATSKRLMATLRPAEQLKVQRIDDEVGSKKPDTYSETLRRHMPRWMWHPLSVSEDDVPAGKTEVVHAAWNGYSAKEASLLIHGERLAEEKSPFHMVFRAADKLDAKGEKDLSYTVRTQAVLDLLAMEKERSGEEYLTEMPFFTYMFGGAMTGEVEKAPRNAHFDYAMAVNDLMLQTFTRFQNEMDANQQGKATKFLQEVSRYYPDHFEEIMARSITSHAKSSDTFDEVSILKGALERQLPWAQGAVEEMQYLPDSRVLTAQEVQELASTLPPIPDGEPITADVSVGNVERILGEEDIFSFSQVIRDKGVNAALNIDLDSFSQTMDVTMEFRDSDGSRIIPFSLSFTGERESLQLDLLTPEGVDQQTAEILRQNTLQAIQRVVEKKNQKDRQQQKTQSKASVVYQPRLQPRVAQQDGEEPAREKVKTRGIPGKATVYARDESAVVAESAEQGVVINDLSLQAVSDLLDREKLSMVTPESVIKRLNRAIKEADARGSNVIGKRVNLDDRHGHLAEGIKLYQINWIVEGKMQLRIYLEDVGSKQFDLVGILNKKGLNHQHSYIEGLLRRLHSEG